MPALALLLQGAPSFNAAQGPAAQGPAARSDSPPPAPRGSLHAALADGVFHQQPSLHEAVSELGLRWLAAAPVSFTNLCDPAEATGLPGWHASPSAHRMADVRAVVGLVQRSWGSWGGGAPGGASGASGGSGGSGGSGSGSGGSSGGSGGGGARSTRQCDAPPWLEERVGATLSALFRLLCEQVRE